MRNNMIKLDDLKENYGVEEMWEMRRIPNLRAKKLKDEYYHVCEGQERTIKLVETRTRKRQQ